MNGKASKLLANIAVADLMTKDLVEMVEAIFHIEDLYELARKNSFIALNFFQLIVNLDYVILKPDAVMPVGSGSLLGENISTKYEFSLKGKLNAIAECFRLQASKMDSMINADTLTAFMQGTGAAQIAQDAVNALLGGGMMVAKEAIKALPAAAAVL